VTKFEVNLALALARCRFLPGSWDKSFVRGMVHRARTAPDEPLTEHQAELMRRLAYKYRRQIPQVMQAELPLYGRGAS
jgi:hypothetical protein